MQIRHVVGCLASAVPYFVLCATLVVVWVSPYSVSGGEWVRYAVGLMALEFVVLHSGAFMGAMAATQKALLRRVLFFAGLAAFYSLVAIGFAVTVDSWAILQVFGFLMAGRFVTLVTAADGGAPEFITRAAVGIVFYLAAVFATLFLPVPGFGITAAVLADVYPGHGGGVWEREPQRAIAAGIAYFALMGLFELFHMRKAPAVARETT